MIQSLLSIGRSVYPVADTALKLGRVLLGALYGFIDGGVAGLLFGWIYKRLRRWYESRL